MSNTPRRSRELTSRTMSPSLSARKARVASPHSVKRPLRKSLGSALAGVRFATPASPKNTPVRGNSTPSKRMSTPGRVATPSGNILVTCRFRPQSQLEEEQGGVNMVTWDNAEPSVVRIHDEYRASASVYTFDRVFDETAKQDDVYEHTGKPIVAEVLQGYNGTVFCYGQTGSGKTYTMEGNDIRDAECMGVGPRVIYGLFAGIVDAAASAEFSVHVSFFEIYMEKVRDLLNPSQDNLNVREDRVRGVYVQHLTERKVASADEALSLLEEGCDARKVGTTNANERSSRSHSVFVIALERTDTDGVVTRSKLSLIDLAGSEKVSKTGAEGHTLEEAKTINKSLSALAGVINALTENGRARHIPYRDSKLTRVLTESLGGNARTALVINCSPSTWNATETETTLRFGMRAKSIRNKAVINLERPAKELQSALDNALQELASKTTYICGLEEELQELREGASGDPLSSSIVEVQAELEETARRLEEETLEKEKLVDMYDEATTRAEESDTLMQRQISLIGQLQEETAKRKASEEEMAGSIAAVRHVCEVAQRVRLQEPPPTDCESEYTLLWELCSNDARRPMAEENDGKDCAAVVLEALRHLVMEMNQKGSVVREKLEEHLHAEQQALQGELQALRADLQRAQLEQATAAGRAQASEEQARREYTRAEEARAQARALLEREGSAGKEIREEMQAALAASELKGKRLEATLAECVAEGAKEGDGRGHRRGEQELEKAVAVQERAVQELERAVQEQREAHELELNMERKAHELEREVHQLELKREREAHELELNREREAYELDLTRQQEARQEMEEQETVARESLEENEKRVHELERMQVERQHLEDLLVGSREKFELQEASLLRVQAEVAVKETALDSLREEAREQQEALFGLRARVPLLELQVSQQAEDLSRLSEEAQQRQEEAREQAAFVATLKQDLASSELARKSEQQHTEARMEEWTREQQELRHVVVDAVSAKDSGTEHEQLLERVRGLLEEARAGWRGEEIHAASTTTTGEVSQETHAEVCLTRDDALARCVSLEDELHRSEREASERHKSVLAALSSLEGEREDLRRTVADLRRNNELLCADVVALKDHAGQLEQDMLDAEGTSASNESLARMTELSDKLESCEEEVAALRRSRDKAIGDLIVAVDARANAVAKLSGLERTVSTLKMERNKAMTASNRLRRQVESLLVAASGTATGEPSTLDDDASFHAMRLSVVSLVGGTAKQQKASDLLGRFRSSLHTRLRKAERTAQDLCVLNTAMEQSNNRLKETRKRMDSDARASCFRAKHLQDQLGEQHDAHSARAVARHGLAAGDENSGAVHQDKRGRLDFRDISVLGERN